jgi:hypothetical protein
MRKEMILALAAAASSVQCTAATGGGRAAPTADLQRRDTLVQELTASCPELRRKERPGKTAARRRHSAGELTDGAIVGVINEDLIDGVVLSKFQIKPSRWTIRLNKDLREVCECVNAYNFGTAMQKLRDLRNLYENDDKSSTGDKPFKTTIDEDRRFGDLLNLLDATVCIRACANGQLHDTQLTALYLNCKPDMALMLFRPKRKDLTVNIVRTAAYFMKVYAWTKLGIGDMWKIVQDNPKRAQRYLSPAAIKVFTWALENKGKQLPLSTFLEAALSDTKVQDYVGNSVTMNPEGVSEKYVDNEIARLKRLEVTE